jgi:hypothetical protein
MAPELPIFGTSRRFLLTADFPAELLQSVLPQFAGMKLYRNVLLGGEVQQLGR